GLLEHAAEQDWTIGDLRAGARGQPVELGIGQVAERASVIEEKLQCGRHADSSQRVKVASCNRHTRSEPNSRSCIMQPLRVSSLRDAAQDLRTHELLGRTGARSRRRMVVDAHPARGLHGHPPLRRLPAPPRHRAQHSQRPPAQAHPPGHPAPRPGAGPPRGTLRIPPDRQGPRALSRYHCAAPVGRSVGGRDGQAAGARDRNRLGRGHRRGQGRKPRRPRACPVRGSAGRRPGRNPRDARTPGGNPQGAQPVLSLRAPDRGRAIMLSGHPIIRGRAGEPSMPAPQLIAANPREVGLDPQKVEALFERAAREVNQGLLPSCQIAIARNGRVGAMRTFGRAVQGGAEREATDETLYTVFSCTKAIMSAAAWILIGEGKLDVRERAAAIVPEFGTNGKEVVTVEQLLLHTAGFPNAPYAQSEWMDRGKRLERFAKWRLEFEPGSRYFYHPTAGFWVIAEIIERRTGKDFRDFVRERIALPLGLPGMYLGLGPELHHRVADVVHVGEPLSAQELRKLGFPP